jgi:hypothetical protein
MLTGDVRRKTCSSANMSTTNLTWTDQVSNPGLRSDIPATDRLSHGSALSTLYPRDAVLLAVTTDNVTDDFQNSVF